MIGEGSLVVLVNLKNWRGYPATGKVIDTDGEKLWSGFIEAEIDVPEELPTVQAEVKEARE